MLSHAVSPHLTQTRGIAGGISVYTPCDAPNGAMPLTEAAIRALKPAGKPRRVADERGLYLEVSVTGSKLWRYKYRFEGREKRLALGTYPDVGLRLARDRREEARSTLARGIDPGAVRRAEKASMQSRRGASFEAIAREFHAKQKDTWSPTHYNRWLGRMAYDLFPVIGSHPITSITAPELLQVLRRVEPRALETAHRLLEQSGQVFRYAIATGRASRDLSSDLRGALQTARVQHLAAPTEPAQFRTVLRAIHSYHASATVSAALRLAPLLFVRPGELRHARKADTDLDAAEWRFVSSKTHQQHIVPLSTQAVTILRDLQPFTGGSEFWFRSIRSRTRPISDSTLLVALRSIGIGKEVTTVHGFRAVARTILDEVLGFRPDIIEHQLAHAVRDANGRAYNRTTFLPERRVMMQRWSDYCDELRSGAVALKRQA